MLKPEPLELELEPKPKPEREREPDPTLLSVRVELDADLSKLAHFFYGDEQSNPRFIVSTSWSDSITDLPLRYDDWLKPHVVKIEPPTGPGLLLFNLYTKVHNQRGVLCTLHAATLTFDMAGFARGIVVDPLKNYRADMMISAVGMAAELIFMPPDYQHPMPYGGTDKTGLGQAIAADMNAVVGLTRGDEFLEKCHVPVYRVADRILPGAAFFSTHRTITITKAWFDRMVDLVAARHGLVTSEWMRDIKTQFSSDSTEVSDKFHRAVGMVLEIATSAVQCYEYIVDFYVDKSENKQMFESFDNYFRKQCGDCEDSAVAIKEILYQMEVVGRHDDTPSGSNMHLLGKVAQVYVPCAVLGMVGNVSFETGKKKMTRHKQAHMYTKWIPRMEFEEKMLTEGGASSPIIEPQQYHPWEAKLMTWVGEGTSTVEPFPTVDWIKKHPVGEDRQAFELALLKHNYPPVGNMTRLYRQRWAGKANDFYDLDIHAYTHKYSDLRGTDPRGSPVVFSFVDAKKHKRWGVNFEEQLRGNYSLLPHVRYSKAVLDDFDTKGKVALPPILLKWTSTKSTPSTWIKAWMSLPTKPINKTPREAGLYTDYIVRGVKQMTESDIVLMNAWFEEKFSRTEKFDEGWDDFSASWRYRCFKANK